MGPCNPFTTPAKSKLQNPSVFSSGLRNLQQKRFSSASSTLFWASPAFTSPSSSPVAISWVNFRLFQCNPVPHEQADQGIVLIFWHACLHSAVMFPISLLRVRVNNSESFFWIKSPISICHSYWAALTFSILPEMCWLKLDTSPPEVLLFPLWMWSTIFIGATVFASSLEREFSEKQANLLVAWIFYSWIRVLNKLQIFMLLVGERCFKWRSHFQPEQAVLSHVLTVLVDIKGEQDDRWWHGAGMYCWKDFQKSQIYLRTLYWSGKSIVGRYCKENQDVLPTTEITDYRKVDICNIVWFL